MAAMTGRDKLLRKMAALPKAARAAMHDALEKSAEDVTALQKRLVRKKSGDAEASIGYTFGDYRQISANVRGVTAGGGGADPDLTVTLHAGDAKAFYIGFLEFGTVHAPAYPFFYPAYRAKKRSIKSRLSRAARKAAREVASGS